MEYGVNIVAGSVSNLRGGKIFNTAAVFDRKGACIAEYDKMHLFTPMGEDGFYARGDHICVFALDGIRCGVIICYDLRFPELTRRLSLDGIPFLGKIPYSRSRATQARPDVLLRHGESSALHEENFQTDFQVPYASADRKLS